MPNLSFEVLGAEAVPYSASPLIVLKLRILNSEDTHRVRSIALNCQIRLAVTQRRYNKQEQDSLFELFGEPQRWGQTLRSMLWTNTSVNVPPFEDEITVDLPVTCTFDFNVAVTKYFGGLTEGDVALELLFSGTVFYQRDDGTLAIDQIPWDREAKFRMPVSIWQDMMNLYYPNISFLSISRDTFEELYRYKIRNGFTSWDDALNSMLAMDNGRSPVAAETPVLEAGLKV